MVLSGSLGLEWRTDPTAADQTAVAYQRFVDGELDIADHPTGIGLVTSPLDASRDAQVHSATRASLPVRIQRIADAPEQAPADFEAPRGRSDQLAWLDADRFELRCATGQTIGINARSITCLRLSDIPGSGGIAAHWELGWTDSEDAEHRAFLETPGFALFPGMAGEGADSFLSESQVLDRRSARPVLHRGCERPRRRPAAQYATGRRLDLLPQLCVRRARPYPSGGDRQRAQPAVAGARAIYDEPAVRRADEEGEWAAWVATAR